MSHEIGDKLAAAVEAVRQGDLPTARPLFREITRLDPGCTEAWVWRAYTSGDSGEALACITRAVRLEPENRAVRRLVYETLKDHLKADPFLKYIREDDRTYVVATKDGRKIVVPKERETSPPYPPREPSILGRVHQWLWLSVAGLLLAGIGAMAGSLAVLLLARRGEKASAFDETGRRRLRAAQWTAAALFLLGSFVGLIFMLHL